MESNDALDPVYDSDRNAGATPPERGPAGENVVGRPVDADEHTTGFHDKAETPGLDREQFSEEEALAEGGSFDGLGLPVADDSTPGPR